MIDERDLLVALEKLDSKTVTLIHQTYFTGLFRYALFRIGDQQIAEDITSETFIRLLEAVNNGKDPKTSLRGWLWGTISNLVNDYYRKKYSQETIELNQNVQSPNDPLELLSERKEKWSIVRSAINSLTSDQIDVIVLRFGNGYSLAETANLMNKNVNAVKALQFRAIASLRRLLQIEVL